MKNNWCKKVLCLAMVVSCLMTALPQTAIAVNDDTESIGQPSSEISEDLLILSEDEQQTEEQPEESEDSEEVEATEQETDTEDQQIEGRFVTSQGMTRFRLKGGGYAVGMLEIEGQLYYFYEEDNRMAQQEWISLDGSRYYASEEGSLVTGKQTIDGQDYFFGTDGVLWTEGWHKLEEGWMYLDRTGSFVTGWYQEGNSWYYLDEQGYMLSNEWVEWKGKWYYLKESGKMAASEWVSWKGNWYYVSGSGIMQANTTLTIKGRKWYFDQYGRLSVTSEHPIDVPVVLQAPALPNGCEITALTELIQFYGFSVSHTTMSAKYLPRAKLTWSGGKLYGPDPYDYFVGNPEDNTGWYCLEGAIMTAANRYLSEHGSSLRAKAVSGADLEELKEYLRQGIPVMVWMTPGLQEFGYSSVRWTLPDGSTYKPYIGTHALVLTSINEEKGIATFSDPARGKTTQQLSFFLRIYRAMGRRAVIIQ